MSDYPTLSARSVLTGRRAGPLWADEQDAQAQAALAEDFRAAVQERGWARIDPDWPLDYEFWAEVADEVEVAHVGGQWKVIADDD